MPSERAARPATGVPNGKQLLDEVNVRLLTELQADPRQSMSELARRVGMSAPAVTERVGRLEAAGVIRGYRVDIDPAAIGLPVSAWVRVRPGPGPGQLGRIADMAARTPQITECYRITGEDCFLLRVYVPAVEDLENVLDRILPYGTTTSAVLVSTPVPVRPLPLPDVRNL
ncbi:Lrp/AsnC family transcriptional regulator [Fodinicola feengrottensis]|uniref:Lrp/AsnC family transcriptional regulator n=1 Tax=Fodinicola feengrottensis TaxID=435914 RepID=A0ABN2HXZ7_9ACTN|nr:Lrp/AsnC family transcriptional regulator [Fodinicola feengrottensis]